MSSSHIMLNADRRSPNRLDAWILGSGISSLASAVSLLQEAHVPPERIHLLESHGVVGGGTASAGDLVNGYHYLAGGMPLFNSVCIEELLSRIPSTARSSKTVLDDMKEYNETNVPKEVPRTRFLVRRPYGLGRIDANRARLGLRDRISVFMLASRSEKSLGRSRISDCFRVGFFKSTYWLTMASTFGFQQWHSAAEFRRHLLRFMHDVDRLNYSRPLENGRYNLHEAIIAPIADFLRSKGVDFRFHTTVTDIITEPADEHKRITAIRVKENNTETTITLRPDDVIIVSLGSVMSGATTGTNTMAPSIELMEIEKDLDGNWLLWLELSSKHRKFGNPYNFCTRMRESRLESFTVTIKTREFFDRLVEVTGNKAGTATVVTLKDSSWQLNLAIPQQPFFPDQPSDVQVFWGYALFPEHKGDFVDKPMINCSGEEIATEFLQHLQFPLERILPKTITIPCITPRMTAALLPRTYGDRPRVIPDGTENLALVGQFVDIEGEAVLTMDYSVRSAQIAVNHLMGLGQDTKKSKSSDIS